MFKTEAGGKGLSHEAKKTEYWGPRDKETEGRENQKTVPNIYFQFNIYSLS